MPARRPKRARVDGHHNGGPTGEDGEHGPSDKPRRMPGWGFRRRIEEAVSRHGNVDGGLTPRRTFGDYAKDHHLCDIAVVEFEDAKSDLLVLSWQDEKTS